MKTITFTFACSLLLAPVAAQVGGSINRDAPKVSRSIEFANGDKVATSFTAIHFGQGKWQDKSNHERINAAAARRPIGTISSTAQVVASNRTIPAGEYDLFFTVQSMQTDDGNERVIWILNLRNKKDKDAKLIQFGMKMQELESKSTRFNIDLSPGADAGSALITISFGTQTVSVPMTVGGGKEEKKGDR